MYKPKFLDKVKTTNFTKSVKRHEIRSTRDGTEYHDLKRSVIKVENISVDDVYTVIGVTNWKEGWSDYIGQDEGYGFLETATKQVYILAKTIGRRVYAFAEDLIPVEEDSAGEDCG